MGNYIFVGLPAGKSTETVRACDTIVSVLSNRETFEPVEVRSGQVLTVMERVRSGLKAGKDLDGQGFEVGDSVILVNGAMKDQHGKVRDFSGPNGMVRVDMQIFNGQAVAVVPLDSLSKV
jgi:transcription antitermination factor NusG